MLSHVATKRDDDSFSPSIASTWPYHMELSAGQSDPSKNMSTQNK